MDATFSLLNEYPQISSLDISLFTDAQRFLLAHTHSSFDIILLDIEMPPLNGFEIAKTIKSVSPETLIIFTTKVSGYAAKGYGLAIRYLQKPIQQNLLFEALNAAIKDVQKEKIIIPLSGNSFVLSVQDIVYAESDRHYVIIHTLTDSYKVRISFKSFISMLPAGYFSIPHNSYVVNLNYIKAISHTELFLTTGHAIPISRNHAKQLLRELYQFIGE